MSIQDNSVSSSTSCIPIRPFRIDTRQNRIFEIGRETGDSHVSSTTSTTATTDTEDDSDVTNCSEDSESSDSGESDDAADNQRSGNAILDQVLSRSPEYIQYAQDMLSGFDDYDPGWELLALGNRNDRSDGESSSDSALQRLFRAEN